MKYYVFLLFIRGMAVEDLNSPQGLKLTNEDYPFANDGLLIWDVNQIDQKPFI